MHTHACAHKYTLIPSAYRQRAHTRAHTLARTHTHTYAHAHAPTLTDRRTDACTHKDRRMHTQRQTPKTRAHTHVLSFTL